VKVSVNRKVSFSTSSPKFWSGGASSMPVGNANFSTTLNSTNSPIIPEPSNIWPIVRFFLAALILAGLLYFFRYR
jgi:hypothetical protein